MKQACKLLGLLLLLFGLTAPAIAEETSAGDAEAMAVLKQMSDFLTAQESFTAHAEITRDELLATGQLVQFASGVDLAVKRPAGFRAEVTGDKRNLSFIYDGKKVTLLHTDKGFFAHINAPDTLEEALQYSLVTFNLEAPLAFVVYKNPIDYLTLDSNEASYLGIHRVLGIACHHLSLRGPDTDLQIWVEAGDKPLLRKMIITEKRVAAAPQFTALLTNWNLAPEFGEGLFTFNKPEGAHEIEFLPAQRHGIFK